MRTRTKDKIRTIRAASDGQGHIEIKRTEVLDGAEYRIDNWRQVSRALGLIIKDQLMLASADESAEQYISEMIATRVHDSGLRRSRASLSGHNPAHWFSSHSHILVHDLQQQVSGRHLGDRDAERHPFDS